MTSENYKPRITVGCSVVKEYYCTWNASDEIKNYAKTPASITEDKGGSSYTIARALKTQGFHPDLVEFVGRHNENCSPKNENRNGLSITSIPCLDHTSSSCILRTIREDGSTEERLKEDKGVIDPIQFQIHRDIIKSSFQNADWRIASGVKDSNEEMLFLSDNFTPGSNNILIPKIELVQSEQWKRIVPMMSMICMNKTEFKASGMKLKDYHDLGLPLIIVTDGAKGGEFSFNGETMSYEAFNCNYSEFHETGAGDWFSASVNIPLWKKSIPNIKDAGFENIKEGILYASRIAGIKIGTPGASNGPSSI